MANETIGVWRIYMHLGDDSAFTARRSDRGDSG